MKYSGLLNHGLAFALISAVLIAIPEASAQFSESWEFLKAVEENDRKEILERQRKGANINARNGDGLPAMILAADQGNLSLMAFIIELGVNVDGRTDERRETALMRRAEVGDTESVRFLVANGADPNLKDKGGETALMKGVRARRRNIVKILIEGGADVNETDYTGRTAFYYAEIARSSSILRLLRESDASN